YRLIGAAVAAVLLLGGLVFYGQRALAARTAEINSLATERNLLDARLTALQPEAKNLEVLKDWDQTALPWLDELYDLVSRWPSRPGLRVTQLNINQVPARNVKEKPVARLTITGVVLEKDIHVIYELQNQINRDKYCKASVLSEAKNTNPTEKGAASEQF